MRAIDLYSGIGGWALGLKIAGIEIISSYEWWEPSAATEENNLGVEVVRGDIRELTLTDLPKNIDIVVGSPPCTQFSYANRGGSGDIADGLKDIAKFLEVVDFLKPKFWVMENVPRVASILEKEMKPNGVLEKFSHLLPEMKVETFLISDFGLPQRRKRCIAGNYPLELLKSYQEKCPVVTLGETVSGFDSDIVKDVNFGNEIPKDQLLDHVKEQFFDNEEERINREAKSYHPVYNDMSFPDPWDRSVRTVTATCTRVSRESVVVDDVSHPGCYRRLTIRERGALQGFPLTYQFFGNSYSQKQKMIGNAIPPVFTYYLANAFRGVKASKLKLLRDTNYKHEAPTLQVPQTIPDQVGKTYPASRRFWFAIPNLRFKSGTRFDLVNDTTSDKTKWVVKFYFGPSVDIRTVELNADTLNRINKLNWYGDIREANDELIETLASTLDKIDLDELQNNWITKTTSAHPFFVLDKLGDTAKSLIENFPEEKKEEAFIFVKTVASECYKKSEPVSFRKLETYASEIFCGLLLGSWFNSKLART